MTMIEKKIGTVFIEMAVNIFTFVKQQKSISVSSFDVRFLTSQQQIHISLVFCSLL